MKTRREFLKQTGLTALATALGCDAATNASVPPAKADAASPPGDTLAEDAVDPLDAPGQPDDAATEVADTSSAPDVPDPPELPDYEHEGPLGPETLFAHGVASGDPLPDRVILWTRVSTGLAEPVPVFWEVAIDGAFAMRVGAGWAEATNDTDFTVHVDAGGLVPGMGYFYRFQALGRVSPVGRTRLPLTPDDAPARVRFAVASCADFGSGHYYAYRDMAAQEVDAVVFLGDYIYEYGNSSNDFRTVLPDHVTETLADYRERYAHYRTETDLQAAHAAHPWVIVWDDHETANNAWRGGNGHGDTGDVWQARLTAATQAWREWMPVRLAPEQPIYRSFDFGGLVRLVMLDTRIIGRDEPALPNAPAGFDADDRQLLGADQEAWLAAEMVTTTAQGQWLVLGQQVMLCPLTDSVAPINYDQWDGYPAARARLFSALATAKVDDLVVLTGDIHSSWASDLPATVAGYDPETGEGSVGVEFVTPGITSGFPLDTPELVDFAKLVNPHIKYAEIAHRGYYVLDIDAERAEATWRYTASIVDSDPTVSPGAVARCERGSRRLTV